MKVYHQRQSSSNEALSPEGYATFQNTATSGHQVFKHKSLWGAFHPQTTEGGSVQALRDCTDHFFIVLREMEARASSCITELHVSALVHSFLSLHHNPLSGSTCLSIHPHAERQNLACLQVSAITAVTNTHTQGCVWMCLQVTG